MNAIPILLPRVEEQFAIVEHLSGEVRKLDRLAGEVNHAIERLQEYPLAANLISAGYSAIDTRAEKWT